MQDELARFEKSLESLKEDVRVIALAIKGDPGLGQRGLVPRVAEVERFIAGTNIGQAVADVQSMKGKIEEMEKTWQFRLGQIAGISAIVSLIVALLCAWIARG